MACSVCYSSIYSQYNYLEYKYLLVPLPTFKFMSDFAAASDISIFQAVLWCFYPVALLVGLELFLRAANDDDDDDPEGGVMSPVYQGV